MGRPFANELAALEATYAWARTLDIGPLRSSLQQATGPLLAVGSGGSFTAAAFAAYLHEDVAGELARAATPLESVTVAPGLRDFHGLIVSAGGKNRDAIQACEAMVNGEPASLTVLCGTPRSPLADLARKAEAALITLEVPSGKDGFLATNSLLAFCTVLSRAYDGPDALPMTLPELMGVESIDAFATRLDEECKAALRRDVLLVLHGPSTRAAALDIESKFSEAALGSVHLSDYRNFGHGRHHWLAKLSGRSAVVALVHETDEPLATKTLAPLPRDVPRVRFELGGSRRQASLAGLVAAFHLTRAAGARRKIDPGRPGVPAFGSRLYSLRIPPARTYSPINVAARRKAKAAHELSNTPRWLPLAHAAFRTLSDGAFTSLAIDYDGTLCGQQERYTGLRPTLAAQLVRLLEEGLAVGIATGRGQSVSKVLRASVPESLWAKVVVGFYNGGYIARLDEDMPSALKTVGAELAPVLAQLQQDDELLDLAKIEARRPQVTVECLDPKNAHRVWDMTQQHVLAANVPGVLTVRSSHSLDVLAPGVSKLGVVQRLGELVPGETLRIGDRGKFPGNDFALLRGPFGLSVDEVSSDANSCWNFAPVGRRGISAALYYLSALRKEGEACRLELEEATP